MIKETCKLCNHNETGAFVIKVQRKLGDGNKVNLAEIGICDSCAEGLVTDQKRYCEWKPDYDYEYYETSCGNCFCVEGTPEENRMKFCPYCGRQLREVKADWEKGEDDGL